MSLACFSSIVLVRGGSNGESVGSIGEHHLDVRRPKDDSPRRFCWLRNTRRVDAGSLS